MICSQCNKEFIRYHGRQKYCSKECVKIYKQEYLKKYLQTDKGKEVKIKASRKYSQTDKAKEEQKKYRQTDRYKKYQKIYQQTDKAKKVKKNAGIKFRLTDKYKEWQKNYQESDKSKEDSKKYQQSEIGKKTHKIYRQSIKYKEYVSKYIKEKRKSDSIFKLKSSVRNRLNNFLSVNNMRKTNGTFKMVGCTPEFLKEYLEKQFKTGMTWQNHKKKGWHIDHKTPLDSAKSPKDIEKLMHYTNLQPLWATENLKKGNKL